MRYLIIQVGSVYCCCRARLSNLYRPILLRLWGWPQRILIEPGSMVNIGRLWNQSSVPAPPQLASGLVSTSDRDRHRLLECIHNQACDLRSCPRIRWFRFVDWDRLHHDPFPILFAVIENDLRRVLAYSLNNQLGFMVVGIGIGTELAINGTVAHAFCHIIYKALLFMSMGAVLYRVGTCKGTELGGLHKSMPWTTVFCIIGAGAISGFPLLSGFVSKSMIISAAGEEHLLWVWLTLLIASQV